MQEYGVNNSLNDTITTINLGPIGGWFQVKTTDPKTGLLAIQTLGQLMIGIEAAIEVQSTAQGVQALLLPNYQSANLFFQNIISNQTLIDLIWYDELYGFNRFVSLSVWIQAVYDGLNSTNTVLLKQYFYLSIDQMSQIYKKLNLTMVQIDQLVYNNYCQKNYTIEMECGPRFYTALQWSSQGLTLDPPAGVPPTDSIMVGNNTATGFVEISFYLKSYFLKKVVPSTDPEYASYASVTFTTEWAYNLLKRGNATNWATDEDILLHVGNLMFIYD